MTITASMPEHAFNLLPKCNESGQKSGHHDVIKNRRKSVNYVLCPVEIHQLPMSK